MKNKWSADKVRLTQRWLIERWPELFKPGPDLLPLALDIHVDILKYREENPDLSRRVLSEALKRHTGSFGYLYGMRKNSHRYNLVGKAVQEVSGEHREIAREKLRQMQKQGRRKVRNGNVAPLNVSETKAARGENDQRSIAKRKTTRVAAKAPVIVYKSPKRRVVHRSENGLSLAG